MLKAQPVKGTRIRRILPGRGLGLDLPSVVSHLGTILMFGQKRSLKIKIAIFEKFETKMINDRLDGFS